MTITIYKASDSFICTILFGLSESPTKTLSNDIFPKIIKVVEDGFFDHFRNFDLNYLWKNIIR